MTLELTGIPVLDFSVYVSAACGIGVLIATLYWRFIWFNKHQHRFKKKSRAVIKGHVHEQIAPLLDHFPYSLTEVKFMGKPIDFLVFCGLDEENVDEVVFLEIKTGPSPRLSATEISLRDAIRQGRVRWEMFIAG